MKKVYVVLLIVTVFLTNCKKANEWLDEPISKRDVVFSTLKDYQNLLNNTAIFNVAMPGISLVGTDNIYIKAASLQGVPVVERNSYLWNSDIFEGRSSADYTSGYQAINYANVVLEGIERIELGTSDLARYNGIKGQALFYRAYMYFELASVFCLPYVIETAKIDKGLCLRTSPDINAKVNRSSVFDTYALILNDAKASLRLLEQTFQYKTRPTKNAAYLLLSRVYLNMSDFENAKLYADSALLISNKLIDFNSVPDIQLSYRFPNFNGNNDEIVFYAQGFPYATLIPNENVNLGLVDTVLYRSYEKNDLRKFYFYLEVDSAVVKFKGSYTGGATVFCGLSTNEAYFIRAECNARIGDLVSAINDLNFVLGKRYRTGSYVDFKSNIQEVVLKKILLERRKEFPFSGNIRWQDLRRNNRDPRLATTIIRNVVGSVKELKPNDPKYVYPFPQNEINLTGIEQNER